MSPLSREGFLGSQTVSIMNFVVVSSVGVMRVDCMCGVFFVVFFVHFHLSIYLLFFILIRN